MQRVTRVGERVYTRQQEVGRPITVDEVIAAAGKDLLLHEESGGGVTFSGGEPLLQARFLVECLRRCKEERLHACVDTAGAARVPLALLEEICRHADLFLYDVKTMNPVTFGRHVGRGFETVKRNLETIARQAREVIIRVPVVPGVNTTRQEAGEIIDFLDTLPGTRRVQLLPYHRTGADKYARLGRRYRMGNTPSMKQEELNEITTWFREAGYLTS